MEKRYTGIVTREGTWFVAHCLELGVVSQGKTIEEARGNLDEAVDLYIESFGEGELPPESSEVMVYPMEVALHG